MSLEATPTPPPTCSVAPPPFLRQPFTGLLTLLSWNTLLLLLLHPLSSSWSPPRDKHQELSVQPSAAPVVTLALTSVSPIRSAAGTRVISPYLARPSPGDRVREWAHALTHTGVPLQLCNCPVAVGTLFVWAPGQMCD